METPKVPKPGRVGEVIEPPEPMKTAKAYKLSRRMDFNGLKISIETDKGESRHWKDPHSGESGSTKMKYPYGYIRRTEGLDGDHLDVYVGPNKRAPNVYVVHQMKAPDFNTADEDKCMLGFLSADAAKKAYLAHYNDDRFFGSMTSMPFEAFKKKALATFGRPQKIAGDLGRALGSLAIDDDVHPALRMLGYGGIGAGTAIALAKLIPALRGRPKLGSLDKESKYVSHVNPRTGEYQTYDIGDLDPSSPEGANRIGEILAQRLAQKHKLPYEGPRHRTFRSGTLHPTTHDHLRRTGTVPGSQLFMRYSSKMAATRAYDLGQQAALEKLGVSDFEHIDEDTTVGEGLAGAAALATAAGAYGGHALERKLSPGATPTTLGERLKKLLGTDVAINQTESHGLNSYFRPSTNTVHVAPKTSPGVLSHELGHASGRKLPMAAYAAGKLGGPIAAMFAAPLLYGVDPDSVAADALTYGPAAIFAPTLLEELRASKRGFSGLRQLGRGGRGLLSQIPTFLTYAAGAAAPIIVGHTIRRYRRERDKPLNRVKNWITNE